MNTYSLDYIDDLYVQYIKDPASVSDVWRRYFEEFSLAAQNEHDATSGEESGFTTAIASLSADPATEEAMWLARMQDRVDQLVREYRVRGHLIAQLDPWGLLDKDHRNSTRNRMVSPRRISTDRLPATRCSMSTAERWATSFRSSVTPTAEASERSSRISTIETSAIGFSAAWRVPKTDLNCRETCKLESTPA